MPETRRSRKTQRQYPRFLRWRERFSKRSVTSGFYYRLAALSFFTPKILYDFGYLYFIPNHNPRHTVGFTVKLYNLWSCLSSCCSTSSKVDVLSILRSLQPPQLTC